jgi:hypothetical protein
LLPLWWRHQQNSCGCHLISSNLISFSTFETLSHKK